MMVSGTVFLLNDSALREPREPAQVQTLPSPYLSDANAANAPYSPTPQLAGRIAPGDYAGTHQFAFPTGGGVLEVFIRQDAITLYLAFDSPDVAPFAISPGGPGPAFQVFLDTQHNNGTLPQTDDYRLTLKKDNTRMENRGTGSDWGGVGTGQWTARAISTTYGWPGEFVIGLSKLGITQTGPISIGLGLAEVWTPTWPKDWYWPSGSSYLNPSPWENLTSSSYWSTF